MFCVFGYVEPSGYLPRVLSEEITYSTMCAPTDSTEQIFVLGRIEVVGKENIPHGRAHVIASNHLSDLDPVYILEAVFSWKRYTILAKQELFKNPLIGWFLSCMGAVPIDRGKGDMGTVNKVTDECKNGTPILIFPEGTRSKTGELLTLKAVLS